MADLYLLGRGREARPYLAPGAQARRPAHAAGKAPQPFERKLLEFLHRQGYR